SRATSDLACDRVDSRRNEPEVIAHQARKLPPVICAVRDDRAEGAQRPQHASSTCAESPGAHCLTLQRARLRVLTSGGGKSNPVLNDVRRVFIRSTPSVNSIPVGPQISNYDSLFLSDLLNRLSRSAQASH